MLVHYLQISQSLLSSNQSFILGIIVWSNNSTLSTDQSKDTRTDRVKFVEDSL